MAEGSTAQRRAEETRAILPARLPSSARHRSTLPSAGHELRLEEETTVKLHRIVQPAFLLLLVGAMAIPAAAQELKTPAFPVELPPPAAEASREVKLSLREAYSRALEKNLDLQIGRYDVATATTSIFEKTGIFDPALRAGINGDWTKSPAATQLAGATINEGRNTAFDLGLGWLLPSGTNLDVDVNAARSETNSQFFFVNPRWAAGLKLSLQQPLLQGFGTLVNRAPIIIARNNRDQSISQFAATVITTLKDVENAYWDLVAARWAVKVREQSLQLAGKLLQETQERVKVGTSASIDLVQSEATMAARQQELIAAKNAADNAEDALKAVLGFDQPGEWDVRIETTDPLETQPFLPELHASIEEALDSRPEIHQELLVLETIKLNIKVARNATFPRLDLKATYGWSGLGGDVTIRDPETGEPIGTFPGGVNDAFRQIRDRDFPGWTLGVNFSMPLGNNTARARLVIQRFALEKEMTRLQALRQQIIRQVRVAVRALQDGAANVDAAHASRIAAEKNAEAEDTKFKNGLSTNFQVLKVQDDLARAQLTEIQAHAVYRKAIVGYLAATGTLLDKEKVAIVDPGQPGIPHDFWTKVRWMQMKGPEHEKDIQEKYLRPAEVEVAPPAGEKEESS